MSTIRVVNIQHTDATEPNIVLEADGTTVFASGITISGGTNLTVSGTAEFASGTVSAPSITFIDDNNTGLYEPAADTVAITTAATERLRIDSSGRLLVGDSSIFANANADDLQIGKTTTANVGLTIGSSTQGQLAFADTGDARAGLIHYQHTDNSMRFYTSGPANERLRIDSSGNVGIGETSPAAGLDIKVNTNPVLAIDRGSANTANFNLQYNGTLTGQLSAANNDFQLSASGASTPMSFYVNGSERMRIDSSGRLLVGTTSTSADARVIIQGRPTAPDSTGRLFISSGNNSPASGDNITLISFTSSNHVEAARIATQRDNGTWTTGSSQPGRLLFSTTADGESSPTERMRIGNTGSFSNNVKGAASGASGATTYTQKYMLALGGISSTGTVSRTVQLANFDANTSYIVTVQAKHNNQGSRIADRSVFLCGNYSSGTVVALTQLGWNNQSGANVTYSTSAAIISCTVTATTPAAPSWISIEVEALGSSPGRIYKDFNSSNGFI